MIKLYLGLITTCICHIRFCQKLNILIQVFSKKISYRQQVTYLNHPRFHLPLIIWEKAALAPFIKEKEIGICINSLEELDGKLEKLTVDDYFKMKSRVIDDEEINIYMMNPKSPCFIKDDEENYIYLILPVNFNAATV